jgi:tRNA G10  N-methylase Trm11
MKIVTLSDALTNAANKVYSELGSLETPDARSKFCEQFLQRWLVLSDDPLTLNPTAASGSYFFLLWKNLSVTNISVNELAALLRSHAKNRHTSRSTKIDFVRTDDYKDFLNNLWQSVFVRASWETRDRTVRERIKRAVKSIVAFHSNFFERTIIFDIYYTSVFVFIPRSIKVDVGAVAMQSGYVHSAGIAIYFRNIEKADRELFRERMKRFLGMQPEKKFFITPYASELFGPYEGRSSVSIRNGLDGVRIQLRKHYFERETLPNFLTWLQKNFENLIIPRGVGSYDDDRAYSLQCGADEKVSIWFVTDSGVKYDPRERIAEKSKDLFIITYAQTHYNHNQFNVFKERKPAWAASTTLPHSLSAAMVNVAKHHVELNAGTKDEKQKIVVLDPFCGTGTTLFDAATRLPDAVVLGLDSSQLMPALVETNAAFFSCRDEQVAPILSMVTAVAGYLRKHIDDDTAANAMAETSRDRSLRFKTPRTSEQEFQYCLALLIRAMNSKEKSGISDAAVVRLSRDGFSPEFVTLINSKAFDLKTKVMFYALWRSLLMNTFSIRSEARTPKGIFMIFLEEMLRCEKEHRDLHKLLGRETRHQAGKHFAWSACGGAYSYESRLRPDFFSGIGRPRALRESALTDKLIGSLKPGTYVCRVGDSVKALAKKKPFADVIISDPPFGFNEFDTEADAVRQLYAEMIPTLIRVLKPWGQLVIALPAFAKNGKQIPFYQTRESVTKQVIATVEAADRRILRNVETVPAEREIFDLPWYWGTASTIERRIIHFLIQ